MQHRSSAIAVAGSTSARRSQPTHSAAARYALLLDESQSARSAEGLGLDPLVTGLKINKVGHVVSNPSSLAFWLRFMEAGANAASYTTTLNGWDSFIASRIGDVEVLKAEDSEWEDNRIMRRMLSVDMEDMMGIDKKMVIPDTCGFERVWEATKTRLPRACRPADRPLSHAHTRTNPRSTPIGAWRTTASPATSSTTSSRPSWRRT